jgi:DNA-binding GntR family transcriptional regulator
MDHGLHKSHGRSIDRETAKEKGLIVINSEDVKIDSLLLSLFNQYQLLFAQSSFYKLFENSRGVNWGRAVQQIQIPLPPIPNQQLMPIQL